MSDREVALAIGLAAAALVLRRHLAIGVVLPGRRRRAKPSADGGLARLGALWSALLRSALPRGHRVARSRETYGVTGTLLGANITGAEKYLGGVLGVDGCVYAVPGKAGRVLKIVPETGECLFIGPHFPGHFKWLRGVACGHKIYCVPCQHERVLLINTTTGEVSLVGDSYPGSWKWHGAVVARDGSVYAIPQKAERVLRIDPRTDQTSLIGPSLGAMHNKWYGGLLAADGSIWGVPTCAGSCLKIVPREGTADVSTVGDLPVGDYKWHGGVVAKDGCIYGIPANSDFVLRIVPGADGVADKVDLLGGPIRTGQHRTDGKYKYLGAVVGRDGSIICIPSDSDYVLRICPDARGGPPAIERIGESLETTEGTQQNKWQNGYLGPDGCIYGIPLKAESILRVVPETGEVSCIQPCGPLRGFNKWEGGVEANGHLYCMPLKATQVLRIEPPQSATDGRSASNYQRAEPGIMHD
ncbi:hypothetical protein T492DRAFT_1089069 [Pavlovales sp. CCMP2436]|nr:hypothetical protein T492DRAFT_1089069 [Pavlovales sp. CCMP2436]